MGNENSRAEKEKRRGIDRSPIAAVEKKLADLVLRDRKAQGVIK